MHGGKAKFVVGAGAVAVVAVVAVLVLRTEDGPEASGPGISVAAGISAVQPDDRGESAAKTARIIGGSEVTIEQYPWQVAIALGPGAASPGTGARERQICGGTLLAPTIVVTAAHCVYDEQTKTFQDPSNFSVISGRTRLSSNQGVETEISDYRYFIDTAKNRPLYSPGVKDWDVVVMVLPAAAIGTPLKIADADEAESWTAGTNAWVSGWGSTDDGRPGSYPNNLQATNVTILKANRCSSAYKYDPETSFCAGDVTGARDTCVGDSGGPLVVTLPDGEARLIGATSFGPNDCGNANLPGFYTRLAADPVRSSLQSLVQELAGVDVVG
jgi:secreted trypsin-like serine protease